MSRFFSIALLWVAAASVQAAQLDPLLQTYRAAGADNFSAQRGGQLWHQAIQQDGKERSCTDCHGEQLTQAGRHVRTGKPIAAMSPQVTADRYTDLKKVEKWFLRNCKWTWGRECTAQEKGDLLTYLIQGE